MRLSCVWVTCLLAAWAASGVAPWTMIPLLIILVPTSALAFRRPEPSPAVLIAESATVFGLWLGLWLVGFAGMGHRDGAEHYSILTLLFGRNHTPLSHTLAEAGMVIGVLSWNLLTLVSLSGQTRNNPGCDRLTKAVFALIPSMSVLLLVWVLVGRAWFGAIGAGLLTIVFQGPMLIGMLGITAVLALTQRPGLPPWLVRVQAGALVTMWCALLLFGAAFVDSTDWSTEPSKEYMSVLTTMFGDDTLELSRRLENLAGTVLWCSWWVLLAALIAARTRWVRRAIYA